MEARAANERVEYFAETLGIARKPRETLLDVGCGNGYAVVEWRRRGLNAFGVDASFYRLSRWISEYPDSRPFVVADAGALPFRSETFNTVISSGMIEHVGVDESSSPYTVRARHNRDESRQRVVSELSRITRSKGATIVDSPNGSFPIDFWHGDRIGAFRVHPVPDVLLPSFSDIRGWATTINSHATLKPLSGRLRFRQVGRHWWGKLLTPIVRIGVAVLDSVIRLGLGGLIAPLLPYLVVELRSRPQPSPDDSHNYN